MAVRTALLTSRNINLDTDFSKYIETVSEPGVITGFEVTASSVAIGQARVPCIRTNLETIYAFVQNFNSVSISWDGYVIITIPQNIIDNWGGNEDGTGIATIEVVNELPAKNYLLLATIESGSVTDNRNMIHKVGELKTDIDSIFASIEDLDERVDALEEAGAIDHLEELELVGEKYALTDTLFKQLTPKLADCTVDANVWDVAANTEIHIQRQGSKTASNKLKLKLKAVGSPTTSVVVEVRKGIQVDVSDSEAYWYGDENNIIATGTLPSSSFTTDYAEVEFTLDANFGGTEWELLDVVVYQSAGSGATVNASNYYVLACDSTQWSEAFSYVKVNGTTRSREKLIPYCVSNWFVQAMLCKADTGLVLQNNYDVNQWETGTTTPQTNYTRNIYTFNVISDDTYNISLLLSCPRVSGGGATLYQWVVVVKNWVPIEESFLNAYDNMQRTDVPYSYSINCNRGDTLELWRTYMNSYPVTINNLKCLTNLTAYKDGKKSKINELKAIWEKATVRIFGILRDGTRWDGN